MSQEHPRGAKSRDPADSLDPSKDGPAEAGLRGDDVTDLLERGLAELSCGQLILTPAGRRALSKSKKKALIADLLHPTARIGPNGSLGGDAGSGAIPEILSANAILPEASATTARQVLHELGSLAHRVYGLNATNVAEVLRQRESVASTGMCGGVALPHAHLPELGAPVGLFARLRQPVDFGADDGMGVDLVFALLSPTVPGVAHLRALARISRLLRDGEVRRKLRGTGDGAALYGLLTDSAS